jgi:hypothetical protein
MLDLAANFLSGQIPKSLGNLTKLNLLYLLGNNQSGPIPHWICLLPNQSDLALHANRLCGSIPRAWCNTLKFWILKKNRKIRFYIIL